MLCELLPPPPPPGGAPAGPEFAPVPLEPRCAGASSCHVVYGVSFDKRSRHAGFRPPCSRAADARPSGPERRVMRAARRWVGGSRLRCQKDPRPLPERKLCRPRRRLHRGDEPENCDVRSGCGTRVSLSAAQTQMRQSGAKLRGNGSVLGFRRVRSRSRRGCVTG